MRRREDVFRSFMLTLLNRCGSRLLELLEPDDARLDVPDDAPEFMQVARRQVRLQVLERSFSGASTPRLCQSLWWS